MYLAHISPSSPQAGFKLNEKSLDLNRSCVLLISHSGGTFGTLNCANLLKGFTEANLFKSRRVAVPQTWQGRAQTARS